MAGDVLGDFNQGFETNHSFINIDYMIMEANNIMVEPLGLEQR